MLITRPPLLRLRAANPPTLPSDTRPAGPETPHELSWGSLVVNLPPFPLA